jgi:hypothetical protein
MLLHTTHKAHLALQGLQTLALRERSLLLLAQRRTPATRLRRLYNGMGEQIVSDLLRDGYLAPGAAAQPQDGQAAVAETSAAPVDE